MCEKCGGSGWIEHGCGCCADPCPDCYYEDEDEEEEEEAE
jgi:hypothetical protein